MERDERVWTVIGGVHDAFVSDGPYISYATEIKVVPEAELQRVQGLLDEANRNIEKLNKAIDIQKSVLNVYRGISK